MKEERRSQEVTEHCAGRALRSERRGLLLTFALHPTSVFQMIIVAVLEALRSLASVGPLRSGARSLANTSLVKLVDRMRFM